MSKSHENAESAASSRAQKHVERRLQLLTERIATAEKAAQEVGEAYAFACLAHGDQTRKSGRAFVSHPTEVALLARENGYGAQVVCAALLHDVISATLVNMDELNNKFGAEIAATVENVTLLEHEIWTSGRPGSVQKLLEEDENAVAITVLGRLANLRDLHHFSEETRLRIVKHTEIFIVPAAAELRLGEVTSELSDLCALFRQPRAMPLLERYVEYRESYLGLFSSPLVAGLGDQFRQIRSVEDAVLGGTRSSVPDDAIRALNSRLEELSLQLGPQRLPQFEDVLGSLGPADLKGVYRWARYLMRGKRAAQVHALAAGRDFGTSEAGRLLLDADRQLGGVKDAWLAVALSCPSALFRRLMSISDGLLRCWKGKERGPEGP